MHDFFFYYTARFQLIAYYDTVITQDLAGHFMLCNALIMHVFRGCTCKHVTISFTCWYPITFHIIIIISYTTATWSSSDSGSKGCCWLRCGKRLSSCHQQWSRGRAGGLPSSHPCSRREADELATWMSRKLTRINRICLFWLSIFPRTQMVMIFLLGNIVDLINDFSWLT